MSGFSGATEGGVLHGYDVVNNLTSTSTTTPLSANMGKTLNDNIDTINSNLKDFVSLGKFSASGTSSVVKIQDCINRVNVPSNDKYMVFCGVPQQSGASLVFGYIYPGKEYGGGIIVSSSSANFWTLSNGTINVIG